MNGLYYYQGNWSVEDVARIGLGDHCLWLGNVVFDGCRSIAGCIPDLDRHCERLVHSARALLMAPRLTASEIADLCCQAVRRFPADAELYLRPMFFTRTGLFLPDAESTEFGLVALVLPLPGHAGFSACLSDLKRPAPDMAPNDAKAACLYPHSQRAVYLARARGFDNAVMTNMAGEVAEFANANLWLVSSGRVLTPRIDGTFLNGITRQRVLALLRAAGVEVTEARIKPAQLLEADEIFSTGNYAKVQHCRRYESRYLVPGPVYELAAGLYQEYTNKNRMVREGYEYSTDR